MSAAYNVAVSGGLRSRRSPEPGMRLCPHFIDSFWTPGGPYGRACLLIRIRKLDQAAAANPGFNRPETRLQY